MGKNSRKYDVFISYRRESGAETAKHLRDVLSARGYRVFFDTDSLGRGDFNLELIEIIKNCKDFILVLTPGALDRCQNPDDWVRQELACALAEGKNVIPLIVKNAVFPEKEELPEDIRRVANMNGVKADLYFFDAMVDKLCTFLESKPERSMLPVALAADPQKAQEETVCGEGVGRDRLCKGDREKKDTAPEIHRDAGILYR